VGDDMSGAASADSPIAIWAHHSLVKGSKMLYDDDDMVEVLSPEVESLLESLLVEVEAEDV